MVTSFSSNLGQGLLSIGNIRAHSMLRIEWKEANVNFDFNNIFGKCYWPYDVLHNQRL